MKLEKFTVCKNCLAVGIIYPDCVCSYSPKYPTIELEYEICGCCNHLLHDGQPADTPFNDKQFKKLEE